MEATTEKRGRTALWGECGVDWHGASIVIEAEQQATQDSPKGTDIQHDRWVCEHSQGGIGGRARVHITKEEAL